LQQSTRGFSNPLRRRSSITSAVRIGAPTIVAKHLNYSPHPAHEVVDVFYVGKRNELGNGQLGGGEGDVQHPSAKSMQINE
jgi:hypothetical protein